MKISSRKTCAATLGDNGKNALYPNGAQKDMAEMSEKFRQIRNEMCVEAAKVNESNRTLVSALTSRPA
jgi:hypothetical protein